MFGKTDIVFVYAPEDIEKIYRNEGQNPIRQGFDSMVYYRTVYRSDFYKKSLGLANG